jgi:hypothetical protein
MRPTITCPRRSVNGSRAAAEPAPRALGSGKGEGRKLKERVDGTHRDVVQSLLMTSLVMPMMRSMMRGRSRGRRSLHTV